MTSRAGILDPVPPTQSSPEPEGAAPSFIFRYGCLLPKPPPSQGAVGSQLPANGEAPKDPLILACHGLAVPGTGLLSGFKKQQQLHSMPPGLPSFQLSLQLLTSQQVHDSTSGEGTAGWGGENSPEKATLMEWQKGCCSFHKHLAKNKRWCLSPPYLAASWTRALMALMLELHHLVLCAGLAGCCRQQ